LTIILIWDYATSYRKHAFLQAFDMYICLCHGVSESAIEAAVRDGARTYRQLSFTTGCGTQCGSCAASAKTLLDEYLQSREQQKAAPPLKICNAA